MDRARRLGLVGLSLGVLWVPQAAEACSSTDWVELVRPAEGDEAHAHSARLLFFSNGPAPTAFYGVQVDGEPAVLVEDARYDRNPHAGGRWILARIEPPPEEGATVMVMQCHVDGEPHEGWCPEGSPLEPWLEYTAGPTDDTAPPAAGAVELTHEVGDFGDMCNGDRGIRISADLSGLDQSDELDVIYVVEVRDSTGERVFERSVRFVEPGSEAHLYDYLGHPPPDVAEHCVSVRAEDLSGNSTPIAEECGSEDVTPGATGSTGADDDGGADGAGSTGEVSMPTPTSTSGSTAPDMPDGTGPPPDAEDAEDGGVLGRGCACTAGGTAGWWAVGLLGLRRRRRAGVR